MLTCDKADWETFVYEGNFIRDEVIVKMRGNERVFFTHIFRQFTARKLS